MADPMGSIFDGDFRIFQLVMGVAPKLAGGFLSWKIPEIDENWGVPLFPGNPHME